MSAQELRASVKVAWDVAEDLIASMRAEEDRSFVLGLRSGIRCLLTTLTAPLPAEDRRFAMQEHQRRADALFARLFPELAVKDKDKH